MTLRELLSDLHMIRSDFRSLPVVVDDGERWPIEVSRVEINYKAVYGGTSRAACKEGVVIVLKP